ncbi:hypothetical protein [Rhodococcus sp. IEGM 1379]|uniref:hypothetical protein n=1 Tax=Rhodococcus sp. IEGM 1379 TaxID=3047086 RepID=UPI0024B799E6|nr:hypothetical protein [Rhodococcus sp. IEGM 1379]MDI9914373.1 hypothetical protein [Rhodococcus sp. IEGM 1379]
MRTRRPDSTAHAIAEHMTVAPAPNRTERRLRRTTIRRGPILGNYVTPSTNSRFAPQSVTAAAEVVYGKSLARQKKRPPIAGWQRESWELRGQVPEFRFAGDRVARGASQYKLFAAKRPDKPGSEPVKIDAGLAYELCSELFGDIAATQQALHRAAQQLTFNGDSLLVVSESEESGLTWAAQSIQELTGQGKTWKLNDGIESRNLNADDVVIRCWKPDPEFQALADCPAKAVLPIARTLRALGQRAGAEIDSRLAGAGILWLPSEGRAEGQHTDDDPDADPFVDELSDNMLIPLQNPDSAAAVVPMIARMPGEMIEKIKHMSFSTPLDEKLPEMETSSIRRIALGMDSPPETLLGMGSANHWTGWLISSEEVTLVTSPTVATICHALTIGFLHPMLQAAGVEDWADHLIWLDASELELRPDKSVDSRELFKEGMLGEETTRRENGFDENDAPTPEEKRTNLLTKLLIGAPSLAPLLLPMLGIEVDASVLNKTANITEATGGSTPDGAPPSEEPTTETTGEQTIPDQPTEQPNDNVETGPGQ